MSFPGYSKNINHLNALINNLRDLGAQLDINVPTVVVCGNQSVGKSSVLQSISGISLPRGHGTCTKCVTEIRLNEGPFWKCKISLRFESDSKVKIIDFAAVDSPVKIELILRRAQKALLNPSKDPLHFTLLKETELGSINELKFSSNVICCEISGSDTTLTLIDLPGIIHSIELDADNQVIEMIESLVKTYIAPESALILACISCKDEIENQVVFHLARQVDPLGYRTIGLLTKPDTIEAGTHDKWLSVLHGNQYSLKSGYYMVKCPSQLEMNTCVYSDESEYFKSTHPWSSVRLTSNRFGIPALRAELCRLLANLVEISIPEMKKTAHAAMDEANTLLESLPSSIDDEKIELLQSIRKFCTLVGSHIRADQNLKSFNHKIRKHFEIFRDAILNCLPKLVNDKPKDSCPPSPNSSYLSGSFLGLVNVNPKSPMLTQESKKKITPKRDGYIITISDLQSIVNAQRGRELDGSYPYGALEFIVSQAQEDWKSHMMNLMNSIAKELTLLVTGLTEDIFSRFSNLKYQLFQNELLKGTTDQLHHVLSMEKRGPFTLNTVSYMRTKQSLLDRIGSSSDVMNETTLKRAMAAIAELGVTNITPSTLMSRLSLGSNTHFYDLFSSAEGYLQISASRFVDCICMNTEHHFLGPFAVLIEKKLLHNLKILEMGKDEIYLLMKEEHNLVEKRARAFERKQRLEQVCKKIDEFGMRE